MTGRDPGFVELRAVRSVAAACGGLWSAGFPRGAWTRHRLPAGWPRAVAAELLCGLAHPSHGSVFVDGQDLGERDLEQLARWRHAELCRCSRSSLIPRRSAAWNLSRMLPPGGGRSARAARRDRVGAALAAWGLGDRAGRRLHRLDDRARRRLVMARAEVQRAELLVIAEPGWRALVRRLLARRCRRDQPAATVIELLAARGSARSRP